MKASEIEYIVREIGTVNEHNIGKVSLGRDYRYDVMVCSIIDHSNQKIPYCRDGKLYRFGYGKHGFTNFQITPHRWHDFPLYEFRFETHKNFSEYYEGKYRDIPIYYPNTISENEASSIISSVEEISKSEIISIQIENEKQFEIRNCKAGSRLPNHCGTGESILYDRELRKIIKQECCWVQ
ncbi:MAG: hypothetical protein JKX81_10145 [Arenicella sp.]|nr:hypothetical protein [Arenicella sp.]